MCAWLVVFSGRSVYILGPTQPGYNLPFAFTVYILLKAAEHPLCHNAAPRVFAVQEEASTVGASIQIICLVILIGFIMVRIAKA